MLAEKPAVQRIKDGKFRKATATAGTKARARKRRGECGWSVSVLLRRRAGLCSLSPVSLFPPLSLLSINSSLKKTRGTTEQREPLGGTGETSS